MCGEWTIIGLPCSHALADISNNRLDVELYCCGCSKFIERHVSPYDWSKMGRACIDGLLSPKLQTKPLSLPDG